MQSHPTRRGFLQGGSALAAGMTFGVHVAHSDVLRVGLVGCGGRGTGAAKDALKADANNRLVAMGDAFADRLAGSLRALTDPEQGLAAQIDVPPERQFTGLDCYQEVIDACDVVLLCEPPHFRPRSLAAAVAAGRHAFVEKPVAVDAPGVRKVLAACAEAKAKKLAIVSGLCWRYDPGMRATFARIHDGGVGEIRALQANYLTGTLWHHARKPEWSDMEYQLRNWLYFTWLSGDLIAEQHIHSLDKIAWAMRDEYPVKATSLGGRQVRTDVRFGHVYDHMATIYEWRSGVRGYSFCRQMDNCASDVNDTVFGSDGVCDVFKHEIRGARPWRYAGAKGNMYELEHRELFASIRRGEPLWNGDYMCKSTLMAIQGRLAAYTGRSVSWDDALQSNEDLTPKSYAFGPLPVAPVALPGITRLG
jgi:predicted dehydrogenase